jgi:hypothetical protein
MGLDGLSAINNWDRSLGLNAKRSRTQFHNHAPLVNRLE